jgi:hypothetical protein
MSDAQDSEEAEASHDSGEDSDDLQEDPDYQPDPHENEGDSDAEEKDGKSAKKLSRKERALLRNTPFPKPGETYHGYLPQIALMIQHLKKTEDAHKRHIGKENPTTELIEEVLAESLAQQIANDNLFYGARAQHRLLNTFRGKVELAADAVMLHFDRSNRTEIIGEFITTALQRSPGSRRGTSKIGTERIEGSLVRNTCGQHIQASLLLLVLPMR